MFPFLLSIGLLQICAEQHCLTDGEVLERIFIDKTSNFDIDKTISALVSLRQQRNETVPRRYLLENGEKATAADMVDDILKELSIRRERLRAEQELEREERRKKNPPNPYAGLVIALLVFGSIITMLICARIRHNERIRNCNQISQQMAPAKVTTVSIKKTNNLVRRKNGGRPKGYVLLVADERDQKNN